jgi:hypothetical protein
MNRLNKVDVSAADVKLDAKLSALAELASVARA